MKTTVKLYGFTESVEATFTIDKNGLTVDTADRYSSSSRCCEKLISQLIDMDSWQHSWNISVSNAKYKNSDERKAVRKIMQDKIVKREKEIQDLKNGIQILSRWNIYT